MLSMAIVLTPVLQLMTHAVSHQLPHPTMHLVLLLHSAQPLLMLILHQPIRVLLLVLMYPQHQTLLLLLGLRQLGLVVLILQHRIGRLMIMRHSGHHAKPLLLLLPLSMQLAGHLGMPYHVHMHRPVRQALRAVMEACCPLPLCLLLLLQLRWRVSATPLTEQRNSLSIC